MAKSRRFPRPSVVFLDGDQDVSDGCLLLPGGEAPERVVFDGIVAVGTDGVAVRLGRSAAEISDACSSAKLLQNHHEWVKFAADRLSVTGNALWQAMCAEWCAKVISDEDADKVGDALLETIVLYGGSQHTHKPGVPLQPTMFPGTGLR